VIVALAMGLAIGGLLAVWPPALPATGTGQATTEPTPSGSTPGEASEAPDVSPPDTGPPLLRLATPPLTSGQETQSFDLEPMGGSAEGWLRSGAEVGIAAFPTSVDRSLRIPGSDAGHWACRSIRGAHSQVRVFADLLLTQEAGGGSPAVSLGTPGQAPPLLIWSEGRLMLAGATDRAGPILRPATWYRIALELDSTADRFTWELAALDPWVHLTRQTVDLSQSDLANADRICISGAGDAAGGALHLDDVRLESGEPR
jgi:hypothetical protein